MFRVIKTSCASWFRCVGVWIWNRFESPTWRRSDSTRISDLSREAWREPLTAFLDVLEADVTELQDIECFISPGAVFGYLERIGFGATLASRKPADKQMVELLAGAVFTMFLDEVNDYYVKPVKDESPDIKVGRSQRTGSTCAVSPAHLSSSNNHRLNTLRRLLAAAEQAPQPERGLRRRPSTEARKYCSGRSQKNP